MSTTAALCRPFSFSHALLLPSSPMLKLNSSCRMTAVSATARARYFSASCRRRQILDISVLPDRIAPQYEKTLTSSLLSLRWPQPPRNILLMPKLHAPKVIVSAIEFAKHIHANYPDLNLVFESHIADTIHDALPFPIYTTPSANCSFHLARKVDLITTMGGDGTILRAASLFSNQNIVPPILSFSMGTLGFLGEWKFNEYKRAWRECYMSGCPATVEDLVGPHTQASATSQLPDKEASGEENQNIQRLSGWDRVRGNGKSMGITRTSKILLRNRLRVGIYDSEGRNLNEQLAAVTDHYGPPQPSADDAFSHSNAHQSISPPPLHAINEVSIDRGHYPHLAIIDIYVNGHHLTEAVSDGILISTPTGSTAYSLSAGGSIVHPLVKSLLITPISPRSLSFRPLVLPLNTQVVLKLSNRNRGRELPVSIDGKRRMGVSAGMEVRVEGESVRKTAGVWRGGVPCVIRAASKTSVNGASEDDDSWVGGLNSLLKFNYPFGESGQGH